jgi:hypothetical protein
MQRQNFASFIRRSRVLWLSLLVGMFGALLESEAADQTVSFGARTDFGTGGGPASVALGDFNGDGKLDLAVANNGSNTVSTLLGTGTGSFGAKTDFGTGTRPISIAVGDFNGDGKLDLAVANENNGGAGTVSILLGTGTGSFGAKTDFVTGPGPWSVAVGDFNGDGNLDLAVANAGNILDPNGTTVSILLGTGTGSFGAKTDFVTGSSPRSVAVGDFNGDGKLDLAVANFISSTVSILLGTGTGSFEAKADFGTGSFPFSIAVGDFNGDGKLDLAVANAGDDAVSILLGTGTGSFGAKTDFGTGNTPLSVAVEDFNGDGKLDLAVANQNANSVSILLGTGAGSFGAKTDFGTGNLPLSVAVGDFNGDGNLDLAVANTASPTVSILLNTTPVVAYGFFSPKTDFATGNDPISVAVGDFNGDGKLDLAVANQGIRTNTVSILLGTGTGSFGAKTDFGTGTPPASVAVGDFNGDGKLDLAVANANVSILLNTPFLFSIGFDSPTVTAQQGTKARVTVNINRSPGFTGNVTVTPPDPALGIAPKPPDPITTMDTNVTFKLKIKGGAALGPHQVTFTGRDDSGHTSTATLTVIVQ